MKYPFAILICILSFISLGQSPGVLDARQQSEKHSTFERYIDIGSDVWDVLNNAYYRGELKLNEGEDTLFNRKREANFFPNRFGLPYLNLYHENQNWALRVFRTIDLETSNNSLFVRGNQDVRWTRESDRSITADTSYNQLQNSIFEEIIGTALERKQLTIHKHPWFQYVADDSEERDSLSQLLPLANKIILKEDYYYNKFTGTTGSHILGIGFYHVDSTNKLNELFWLYYPEVRYVLIYHQFRHFNHKLNWKENITYNDIFENHQYDTESIHTVPHTINMWQFSRKPPKSKYSEHDTDIDALFYVSLIKTHVRNDYRNYTGIIDDPIHDQLRITGNLVNGIMQGTWKIINPDKTTKVSIEMMDNLPSGNYTEYWDGKQIRETGMFLNGLKSGIWKGFFDSGKKLYVKNYSSGWMDGKQEIWYENGKKHLEYSYSNFMLNGSFCRKTQKGEFIEQGYFTDDFPDSLWQINLEIPEKYISVIMNNPQLEWEFPLDSFKDGVLSYEVELEQGEFKTNCPSPVLKCVRMVSRSEIR